MVRKIFSNAVKICMLLSEFDIEIIKNDQSANGVTEIQILHF